jgi:hypothetical protein
MIQMLTDFPDNVVAASASGVVTKRDYQECLVPRVELALKRHPKIRCYYELGPQFSRMEPGAMWEDFKNRDRASLALGACGGGQRCRLDQARRQRLSLPDAGRGPDLCYFGDGRGPRMDHGGVRLMRPRPVAARCGKITVTRAARARNALAP